MGQKKHGDGPPGCRVVADERIKMRPLEGSDGSANSGYDETYLVSRTKQDDGAGVN